MSENPRSTGMSLRYRIFRWSVTEIFRLLSGLTIEGQENVPREGALVVAANHSQYLDPVFVCTAVPRRIQWMAKKELFVFPFRRFFRFLGTFPVDRQSGGRAALRAALSYLSEGWALGIFPEGTHRTDRPDDARQPKNGAVMLASRGKAPVLPVYVGKMPTLSARLKGERLHAYIGPLVTIDNTLRGREAYRRASEEILAAIYGLPEERGGGRG